MSVQQYLQIETAHDNQYELPDVISDSSVLAMENTASMSAFLAFLDDKDPVAEFNRVQGQPVELIEQQIVQEDVQVQKQALSEATNEILTQDYESANTLVPAVKEQVKEIEEFANHPLAPQIAVLRQTDPTMPKDLLLYEAEQMYYSQSIGKFFNYDSYLSTDFAGDVAGVLVGGDYLKDTTDLLGGSIEDAPEKWLNFIYNFNGQPLEKRLIMFNQLRKDLLDTEDQNELKVAFRLLELVDPTAAERSVTIGTIGDALDAAGFASIGLGMIGRVASTARKFSYLNTLSKAGRKEKAANLADAVMASEDVAKSAKTRRVDAAQAASGFQPIEGLFDGAPSDMAKAIDDHRATISSKVQETVEDLIPEGLGLSREAEVAAQQKALLKAQQAPGVTDVQIAASDKKGFTLKYRYGEDGVEAKAKVTQDIRYTVDDVTGDLDATEYLATGEAKVASPNFMFSRSKDREKLVNTFTRLMFQSDVLRSTFDGILTNSIKGLGPKSMKKLDKILRHGDLEETVFDYRTLKHIGFDGVKLNDKEIESYYKLRDLMDLAWAQKNQEVYDSLAVKGLKTFVEGDEIKFVKQYDELKNASSAITSSENLTAKVMDDVEPYTIMLKDSGDKLEELYNKGYKLIRAADDEFFKVGEDSYVKFLFVNKSQVKELPKRVLNYKKGYIPRDYQDGFYFAKKKVKGVVDAAAELGAKERIISRKTERYFTSKTEADAFVKTQNDNYLISKYGSVEEAPLDVDLPYEVLHDRQMAATDAAKEVTGIGGGKLYTGARKDQPLLQGIDGKPADFVPVMESISKYYNNIAARMPMNAYRSGIERTWIERAKTLGVLPKNYSGGFLEAPSHFIADSSKKYKHTLEQMHEHLKFQMRVPTHGEREVETLTRELAEWTEDIPFLRGISSSIHRLDHRDPIAAIKSGVFHSFLGVFNLAQAVVQSFGATIAMSIRPDLFPKAMPRVMGLQILDNIQHPEALAKASKLIGGKTGVDDLEAMHKAWRRTGLYESTVKSSADFEAMTKGYPMDGGFIKKFLDKGLAPYKFGELFNRRYSFSTAFLEYTKKNPGKVIDDDALKQIVNRTNAFMLQMHRTNKAYWQRSGVLSIPTQFQQVQARYFEALLGNEFTRSERARLFTMQLGMFGAASIPLVDWIGEKAVSFTGLQPQDVNTTTASALKEGLLSYVLKDVFGVHAEVSTRGSIGINYDQVIMDLLNGEATVSETVFGASSGAFGRAYGNAIRIKNILLGQDLGDMDAGTALAVLDATLDTASSWKNASQAYELMHNPVFRNQKTGEPLFYSDDVNTQTKVAAALGFQLSKVADMYAAAQTDRAIRTRIIEKSNAIMRTLGDLGALEIQLTDKKAEAAQRVIANMMASEKPAVRKKIEESVLKQLTKQETRESRMLMQFLRNQFEGLYEGVGFHPAERQLGQ